MRKRIPSNEELERLYECDSCNCKVPFKHIYSCDECHSHYCIENPRCFYTICADSPLKKDEIQVLKSCPNCGNLDYHFKKICKRLGLKITKVS